MKNILAGLLAMAISSAFAEERINSFEQVLAVRLYESGIAHSFGNAMLIDNAEGELASKLREKELGNIQWCIKALLIQAPLNSENIDLDKKKALQDQVDNNKVVMRGIKRLLYGEAKVGSAEPAVLAMIDHYIATGTLLGFVPPHP